MKIEQVTIHNFRSIVDLALKLEDYSLLIGANNSGKTNIIDAIRIFYEKDIKFNKNKDIPKASPYISESWIEIKYKLSPDEFDMLKENYKAEIDTLRVRKYLYSETEPQKVKANQSNIYAYEKDGALSKNLFYGAKSVAEGKLGNVLFVPELSKVDEYTKLSGPSTLRDILEFVFARVLKRSESFKQLSSAFDEFNLRFGEEKGGGGYSIKKLQDQINKEIETWNATFGFSINTIRAEDIIKTLLKHYLRDENIPGADMDLGSFGQGMQRHLIYVLIKLSATYREDVEPNDKKEFRPDFTLILFEEPEAFLHPAQQETLNMSLREVSKGSSEQVLITTHSSHLVSKNISGITSMIKLRKEGPKTLGSQLRQPELDELLKVNTELKTILGEPEGEKDLDYESFWYSLYMDPDRCCSFFADRVLICEGACEKLLIDQLITEKKWIPKVQRLYILQSAGKENLHRYMNLFEKMGIDHSVMFDGDSDKDRHGKINAFINSKKNPFTRELYQFESNLENFLEIAEESKRWRKPLNVLWHYRNGKIGIDRMEKYIKILDSLAN